MLLIYRICIYLALPFFLLRLIFKASNNSLYRKNLHQRFGFYRSETAQLNGIVVHAVSVGEVNAASVLIRALQKKYPHLPITVTCMTPTGSARVKALFADSVQHVYLPYDYIGAMHRFVNFLRPQMLIIMETEIWPNLLMQCRKQHIKVVFANVRLSQRSFKGYARFKKLTRKIFQSVSIFLVQSQQDATHISALGANKEAIYVCGNLKFDSAVNKKALELKQATRDMFDNRPILVAASTRDGEEQKVLAAYKQIRANIPDVVLILVPRHPERADDVADLITQAGYAFARYSEHQWLSGLCNDSFGTYQFDSRIDILLVDAIGQLAQYYAAADIAFVGGSLVDTGCQNVLEPCAYHVPVLFGPSVYNFAQITTLLLENKAAIQVQNSEQLAKHVCSVLQDDALAHLLTRNASSVIADNAGASDRQLQHISALLDAKTAG